MNRYIINFMHEGVWRSEYFTGDYPHEAIEKMLSKYTGFVQFLNSQMVLQCR